MTVSAVSLWRMAFRLERRFPDSVLGPVLRLAFWRLTWICFWVAINEKGAAWWAAPVIFSDSMVAGGWAWTRAGGVDVVERNGEIFGKVTK